MKKYLIVALAALAVITAFGILIHQNKKLRRERDAYRNNTEVLLGEVERYQTKSGEQAIRVGELQLRVAELERYRADDATLIRDMGVKKKELEQLTKIQQQTIYKLQGEARDTVFVEVAPDGSSEVPARCAEHHDEWLDFHAAYSPIIATRPTSQAATGSPTWSASSMRGSSGSFGERSASSRVISPS